MKSQKSEILFSVDLGEPYGKRRVQAMALFALHWTKKHRSRLFAGDIINQWWYLYYDEVCVCLSVFVCVCVCVASLNCVKTRFKMCSELFQKLVDKLTFVFIFFWWYLSFFPPLTSIPFQINCYGLLFSCIFTFWQTVSFRSSTRISFFGSSWSSTQTKAL